MNLTLQITTLVIIALILIEVTYILYKLNKKQSIDSNNQILVDTSVLMDGRIVSIANSGFIIGVLVIPRSVIGELQFLADNADSDKRARARKALDVVKELQDNDKVEVLLLQDGSKAKEGVDERLLKLAKQRGGYIMTIDYNLNKVATVEDIRVLNVNELAQSIRMAHLPGEKMHLDIVQKGQENNQGVGYLTDGTMVVVEQAASLIGQNKEIEVIRSLQTAAGKMMFAKLVQNHKNSQTKRTLTNHKKPAGKKPSSASSQKPKAVILTEPKASNKTNKKVANKNQQRGRRNVEASFIDLVEKSNQ